MFFRLSRLSFLSFFHSTCIKLHTVANPRNARFLFVFGIVCSVTYLLPTSAVVVSAELEKLGDVAIALEGLTDAWRGKYRGTPVVINAFRFYSPRDLKQAKEVCIECTR